MPRPFTSRGYRALQAEVEDAALLALVTISYEPTGAILRAVNNTEIVTSRGDDFYPWAFEFQLPEDSLDRTPELTFVIDNVAQELVDLIRQAIEPPQLTIEVVVSDTPDVVELTIDELILRRVEWDRQRITASLQINDVIGGGFPSYFAIYDPYQYPALFP